MPAWRRQLRAGDPGRDRCENGLANDIICNFNEDDGSCETPDYCTMCHDRCDDQPEAEQEVCHQRCDLNAICCGDSCANPMDTCETFFGRHVTFETTPQLDGSFHTTDATMTNEERCIARDGCGYEPDGDQDWDGAGWCVNNAGNECREYLCVNPRTCAAGETPVRDNCWRFNPNPETGVHEPSAREEELGLHQCIWGHSCTW